MHGHNARSVVCCTQASWHPSSSAHFAALTSDGCWRLYHSARLEEPEQSFALRLPGTRGSIGLRRGPAPRATAFAFAPPGRGWASLAVLLLSSDGAIYCLCPVAPFGMRASATALQHLLEEATGTARSWLLVRRGEAGEAEGGVCACVSQCCTVCCCS